MITILLQLAIMLRVILAMLFIDLIISAPLSHILEAPKPGLDFIGCYASVRAGDKSGGYATFIGFPAEGCFISADKFGGVRHICRVSCGRLGIFFG